MGTQQRPTESITYQQAQAYETSRVKWYDVYGYITNVAELSQIFNVQHTTLIKRLQAGWPLNAALLADTKMQLTINNCHLLENLPSTVPTVKAILEKHFTPKKAISKKVTKGE